MARQPYLAWLVVAAAACSGPAGSPSVDPPARGMSSSSEARVSPDQDGLRGKLAGCLGISLDTAIAWLMPEETGGIIASERACLTEAATCGDLQRCLGVEPGPCPKPECEGTVAKGCWALRDRPPLIDAQDCGTDRDGNNTCFITSGHGPDEAFAQCGAGSCRADACDGDSLVQCIDGVGVYEDCGRVGKRCIETSGVAFCGFDETCTKSRCEGDTAVICDFGHVVFRQACGEIDLARGKLRRGALSRLLRRSAIGCKLRGFARRLPGRPCTPLQPRHLD
jgi:hypothetical protein